MENIVYGCISPKAGHGHNLRYRVLLKRMKGKNQESLSVLFYSSGLRLVSKEVTRVWVRKVGITFSGRIQFFNSILFSFCSIYSALSISVMCICALADAIASAKGGG